MSKFKRTNKKNNVKYGILALILVITIGYALLNETLNITGTSNFARTTWDIHFENLVPDTNMTLGNGEGATITSNKTTEVTYTLNFDTPGQYYEFLVDAKNDGTIDGMVSTVTSTIKIGDAQATPITDNPSNLPSYLYYTATYEDDVPIEQYHLLAAGEKETYKVIVAFRDDIEANELPGSAQSIELTFGVDYIQKDEHAVPSHPTYTYYLGWDSNMSADIGDQIPQGVQLRNSLEEIRTEEGYDFPFIIKYVVNGRNEILESYIEFIIDDDYKERMKSRYDNLTIADEEKIDNLVNGVYEIKVVEEDNVDVYNQNIDVLKTAFNYDVQPEVCQYPVMFSSDQRESFQCGIDNGLYAETDLRGSAHIVDQSLGRHYGNYCNLSLTGGLCTWPNF